MALSSEPMFPSCPNGVSPRAEVCFGYGDCLVRATGICEPPHGKVEVVNDAARLNNASRLNFHVLRRVGVTQQSDVVPALKRCIGCSANAPVGGRAGQEDAGDAKAIQLTQQVGALERRVVAFVDADFPSERLKLRNPLPSRCVALQLFVVVLYPDYRHAGITRPANRERCVANDAIAIPRLVNNSDLHVNDEQRGTGTGASSHGVRTFK